jgi:hypothetical protein
MASMDKEKIISNEIDWEYQNKLRQQWLMDNPEAEYQGWMSI